MSTGGTPGRKRPASDPAIDHLLPGSIVFAKMKSFPPWPAKVISAEEYPGSLPKNQVPVQFLGTHDYGHVLAKECYPFADNRTKFGSPKQRPKYAEAMQEAEKLIDQQGSKKRTASKEVQESEEASSTPTSSGASPAKRPRGRQPKVTKDESLKPAAKVTTPRHEPDEALAAARLLPESQLDEIAASTVFESEPDTQFSSVGERRHTPAGRGAPALEEPEEEEVDDAITNVVRQLEELEKQEADERMRNQAETPTTTSSKIISEPSTASKRRGRPSRTISSPEGIALTDLPITQAAKNVPSRAIHERSLSENTDDGQGIGLGRHSSGSETPLSGNESGQLGKRRHKPKVMSDYFLEYDYASPRSHKKSESTPAAAASAASSSKSHLAKTSKATPIERQPKVSPAKPKKASVPKLSKDMEKASLEAEIAHVKMAAQENQGAQQQQPQVFEPQPWQRQDTFADLPFDDSMFEMTVDVEESPTGQGALNIEGPSTSHAMIKRRKDAVALAKEKERMKQKQKLKVKLLKGLLPAPRIVEKGKKGKKQTPAILTAAKKKSLVAEKMKVKLAKKKATKAAKIVAAAEIKEKKKRGRKPLLIKKPKPEKRVTGYSLWAEHEMEMIRTEHPNIKGLGDVRDLLQARYQQLSDTEKKTWKIMAKRERERRANEENPAAKKVMPVPISTPGAILEGKGFQYRFAGGTTSSTGTPTSPGASRVFVMSPSQGASSGIDIGHHQQLPFDHGMGIQQSAYDEVGPMQPYDGSIGGQGMYASTMGFQQPYQQQVGMTPTPVKRGRGRPRKYPAPDQPPGSVPKSQHRSPQRPQGASAMMGYQALAPLPKGVKIPKKEGAIGQQAKPPLKILTAGQRRAPFHVRSPEQIRMQNRAMVHSALGDPSVPDEMSHEELVYDSETAAMAAAAAEAIDMAQVGLMSDDGVVEEVAYGHIGQHPHELGEETDAAVSYLTGDHQLSPTKSRPRTEEERQARKRESKKRSREKQRALKEQHKFGQVGQAQTPIRQKRTSAGASYAVGEETYGSQMSAPQPAAYEVAYVDSRPTEEETNMFFFGTTQDVQALLEVRNQPGPMEGMCRWWLTDDIDPELQGHKKGSQRGQSPPRALTAEPLDAAAVFKLIGRSFETVGNQLMREETEDSPHEMAAGLDMLMDALVSSVSHLLTLTGAIPPFDRRYRRDVLSRLVEETSMMIPL